MICLRLAGVLARLEEAVELLAFAKDRRLGRVQVLRLAGVEHAAAEADDLAARVADREHDAVAEPVVAAAASFASDSPACVSCAMRASDVPSCRSTVSHASGA